MEKTYSIDLSDGYTLKWVLNWQTSTQKLIIFVHGFKWNLNEAHYVCARDFFTKRGYATFRFNLYSVSETSRKLHTTTVKEHSFDTQKVIDFFSNTYDSISIVWHSLWCPTIIGLPDISGIDSIIFWDPAFDMKTSAEKIFSQDKKYFVLSSWKHVQVWEQMLREFQTIDYFQVFKDISFQKKNTGIIYASEDRHVNFKPHTDTLWIRSHVVEWADHCFTREGNLEELFNTTLKFIEN